MVCKCCEFAAFAYDSRDWHHMSMSEDLKKLQEELEAAKKQADEYLDGWKRAKADYANREKDLAREKSEYLKFANARLFLEFLAIYESFVQAVETQGLASPQDGVVETQGLASLPDNVIDGFLGIKKQFEDLFKKHGLEKIKTLGERFDYNLHEAAGVEKQEGANSGEIIKEIQAGYKLYGEILRPAKVIIAE